MLNLLDFEYKKIVSKILSSGEKREDRTGTGTLSLFDINFSFNYNTVFFDSKHSYFPILTCKEVYFKSVVSELLWFLKGRTDMEYLLDRKNYIWVGDAAKKMNKDYSKEYGFEITKEVFLEKFNETREKSKSENMHVAEVNKGLFSFFNEILGPVYGKQFRGSKNERRTSKDQLFFVIDSLINNPYDRGIIIDLWNVQDLNKMALRPCHYSCQFYVSNVLSLNGGKKTLHLKWIQRSVDVGLGLPFNISSYALFLHILCFALDFDPGSISCSMGDTHIYLDHVDPIFEILDRKDHILPFLKLNLEKPKRDVNSIIDFIESINEEDIVLENYNHSGKLSLNLSN